jgi:multidrug efflux pump subunit AcrA (membrane-fusion protein)
MLLVLPLLACWGGGEQAGEGGEQVVTLFTETGNLQTVSSTRIVMPWFSSSYGQPQITYLVPEGTEVSKGDTVAELDKSGVLNALKNAQSNLEIAVADLRSLEINQTTELEKLEGALQQKLSRFRQAEIDTQRVAYESASRKQASLLELQKARIELDRSRAKIASTRRVQEQDLRIQQAKIEQTRGAIETAERTLASYSLIAIAPGMAVYSFTGRRNDRRKVQVGDKLWNGDAIIQLPDMSRMKAETAINETDISKIKAGQKVRVRLDAYPLKVFDGVLSWVSLTCRGKSRNSDIKVFDAEVLIDGSDRILKPGMTVSCEFLSTVAPVTARP